MKKTRGLILILCPLLVGGLWILTSAFFWMVATVGVDTTAMDPQLLLVIKNFANRGLGMLSLLSLVLLIVGIVLLATSSDTKISVKEAIGYGWEKSKAHTRRFLLGFGIIIALQIINSIFNLQKVETQTTLGMIVGMVVNVLNLWIVFGLTKIALDIVYEREYKVASLFVGFMKTLKYIVAYIVNMIIILAGLLLLIFPGIIWGFKLSMVPYLILEKDYGPFKAINRSWRMTKGYVGDIFAISVIAGLINILGMIAIFVGLLWTIPLLLIANAYIYRKIADARKDVLVD